MNRMGKVKASLSITYYLAAHFLVVVENRENQGRGGEGRTALKHLQPACSHRCFVPRGSIHASYACSELKQDIPVQGGRKTADR